MTSTRVGALASACCGAGGGSRGPWWMLVLGAVAAVSSFAPPTAVEARTVNISNAWVLPQEGFPVFYRYFRDHISWFEADAVCQFHHANLVTVDNSVQFDTTRAYLKELDVVNNVWIGLKKGGPNEQFAWTDYKPLGTSGGYWLEAIPLSEGPLCAALDPAADFRWHSLDCGGQETASFICELPVPPWARRDDGCLLTALPSLTVTFLPDKAAVELSADCGMDGTRRVQCRGAADREEMVRQLSCDQVNSSAEEDPAAVATDSSPGSSTSNASTNPATATASIATTDDVSASATDEESSAAESSPSESGSEIVPTAAPPAAASSVPASPSAPGADGTPPPPPPPPVPTAAPAPAFADHDHFSATVNTGTAASVATSEDSDDDPGPVVVAAVIAAAPTAAPTVVTAGPAAAAPAVPMAVASVSPAAAPAAAPAADTATEASSVSHAPLNAAVSWTPEPPTRHRRDAYGTASSQALLAASLASTPAATEQPHPPPPPAVDIIVVAAAPAPATATSSSSTLSPPPPSPPPPAPTPSPAPAHAADPASDKSLVAAATASTPASLEAATAGAPPTPGNNNSAPPTTAAAAAGAGAQDATSDDRRRQFLPAPLRALPASQPATAAASSVAASTVGTPNSSSAVIAVPIGAPAGDWPPPPPAVVAASSGAMEGAVALEPASIAASEEPLDAEPEAPTRPNRGRRLMRPQGHSFYPYFLNRVLG